MNEQEFLQHHGLMRNPFADEDAQTDAVFKDHCIGTTFHPAWSKVLGDPREPATAIVFGSKGSGKTAMRLQLAKQLRKFNAENPSGQIFVVSYDDFNSYLGPLQQSLPRRLQGKPDRILQSVRLWDHMDAILCEAVTRLVQGALQPNLAPELESIPVERLTQLDRGQRRDFLLLAACYDQSKFGAFRERWHQLRRLLRYVNWKSWIDLTGAVLGMLLALVLFLFLYQREVLSLKSSVYALAIASILVWLPYLIRSFRCFWKAYRFVRNVRVGRRDLFDMFKVLMALPGTDLASQPLPLAHRTDDRYALLEKLQMLLRSLGYAGVIVMVDRVDEPDLVNGQPERMRQLVWPLLDNKLLKHPGIGFKMLLPNDLQYFVDRENREFQERARLDKQNVVANFDWTGEALHDVVDARMKACSSSGQRIGLEDLLEPSVTESRLLQAMQSLKTPRALFRFLYRMVGEHCKRYRSTSPQYRISSDVFESTLAVFQAELNRNPAS